MPLMFCRLEQETHSGLDEYRWVISGINTDFVVAITPAIPSNTEVYTRIKLSDRNGDLTVEEGFYEVCRAFNEATGSGNNYTNAPGVTCAQQAGPSNAPLPPGK